MTNMKITSSFLEKLWYFFVKFPSLQNFKKIEIFDKMHFVTEFEIALMKHFSNQFILLFKDVFRLWW